MLPRQVCVRGSLIVVRGRFVGIGVDQYSGVGLDDLGHPVRDVSAVQVLLKSALEGDILPNPTDTRAIGDGLSRLAVLAHRFRWEPDLAAEFA